MEKFDTCAFLDNLYTKVISSLILLTSFLVGVAVGCEIGRATGGM